MDKITAPGKDASELDWLIYMASKTSAISKDIREIKAHNQEQDKKLEEIRQCIQPLALSRCLFAAIFRVHGWKIIALTIGTVAAWLLALRGG